MNDCKHKYYINEDKQTECRHCGLLKSTIESGDIAPHNQIRQGAERLSIVSPDSWEIKFREKYSPIPGKYLNLIEPFIRNLLSEIIESIPEHMINGYEAPGSSINGTVKQQLRSKYGIKRI